MKLDDLTKRIDELLTKAEQVRDSKTSDSFGIEFVDSTKLQGLRVSSLSFIKNLFGEDHPYFKEFNDSTKDDYLSSVDYAKEILGSIKEEMIGGWIFTTKGIVSAEIFADFMEMAEHLLKEGYKDAAAVMIGSVLEEHLRQLCTKHSIDIEILVKGKKTPKKADSMNSDLGNKPVYNKLDQKNVTAWLDLRNKAAHGKYSDYTDKQVENMYNGVMDFMSRNSI